MINVHSITLTSQISTQLTKRNEMSLNVCIPVDTATLTAALSVSSAKSELMGWMLVNIGTPTTGMYEESQSYVCIENPTRWDETTRTPLFVVC